MSQPCYCRCLEAQVRHEHVWPRHQGRLDREDWWPSRPPGVPLPPSRSHPGSRCRFSPRCRRRGTPGRSPRIMRATLFTMPARSRSATSAAHRSSERSASPARPGVQISFSDMRRMSHAAGFAAMTRPSGTVKSTPSGLCRYNALYALPPIRSPASRRGLTETVCCSTPTAGSAGCGLGDDGRPRVQNLAVSSTCRRRRPYSRHNRWRMCGRCSRAGMRHPVASQRDDGTRLLEWPRPELVIMCPTVPWSDGYSPLHDGSRGLPPGHGTGAAEIVRSGRHVP